MKRAFTLIEVLVGSAVFLTVAMAAYGAYAGIFKLATANQDRIVAVDLANEQFEMIRNMPYSEIGIVDGIPEGVLPATTTLVRGGITFSLSYVIRNIDLPFDGLIGSTTDNDPSPDDNKLVQVTVTCPSCQSFSPVIVSAQIAPKNLETSSSNGALFVKVFDSAGNPIAGASVHIANSSTTNPITIDDTTPNNGVLQVVDVPPDTTAYSIYVSKAGYSSDQTYQASSTNPTPAVPPATVAAQTLTTVSLTIDKVSSLAVSSVGLTCAAVPNVPLTLQGSETISAPGAVPPVLLYSKSLSTDGSGNLSLSSMNPDSYTFLPRGSSYDIAGINPINPVSLNPGSSQNVQLVAVPRSGNALLVTVKDHSLPVSGASVTLSKAGYSSTQVTGTGYMTQSAWDGGPGSPVYSATTTSRYWNDSSTVDPSAPGTLKLKGTGIGGNYFTSGWLESSTFDTGTASNFTGLIWNPNNQPLATGPNSVEFQFAASASSSPDAWNFVGPDGTSGTYYTSPNTTFTAGIFNGMRYARYKAFLSTASATNTPSVSNISFTYTSGCNPPGQVLFQGLSAGAYTVNVSATGYDPYSASASVGNGWQEYQASL